MFKRFTVEDNVSSVSQVKNSVQRQIQSQIVQQYPLLEEAIDDILPKKHMQIGKGADGLQLVIVDNEILFYCVREGPFYPTLKLLHKFPTMMPNKLQVDKGAIPFVLGGANMMCPGFTSKGGKLPSENIPVGEPVAIFAEGCVHAMAIGKLLMSTDQMKAVNKGIGVENVHYLNDGLWQTKSI
jgi:malignant T-cell-amplified sequence